MPQFLVETPHAGEYIISEAAGLRSRDNITLGINAAVVVAGTVLGQKTVGAATAAAKSGGNTGNATISAVTVLAGAQNGIYTVRFLTATTYRVEDPQGDVIGDGATGVAFSDDVSFTITAGGTPMVAGDGFDITVAAGDLSYVPLDLAAVTGAQSAAAILYGTQAISASATAQTAHTRACEVNGAILTWPAGISGPQKAAAIAQLAAKGIIVRPPVL